jgi:hypothetical protein
MQLHVELVLHQKYLISVDLYRLTNVTFFTNDKIYLVNSTYI